MAIKLLLAEDDLQLVDMYSRKFELEGFEVQVAEDGKKAIEILKEFTPDIAILDVMMPEVDGLEVLEYIKKTPKLNKVITIMLTNMSDQGTAEKIYELGATEYLVKAELTPLEVANKVKSLIDIYKKEL
ncbi:MAG: response regulator [Patescibacteria group bacterium]|jgi:two-component system alkaline phosphatase synthesis response regulator PhoP|nr:response regulator [Patescibacteria group bacterium]